MNITEKFSVTVNDIDYEVRPETTIADKISTTKFTVNVNGNDNVLTMDLMSEEDDIMAGVVYDSIVEAILDEIACEINVIVASK